MPTLWMCDCCEKDFPSDQIHVMWDGDESLCNDCLESYLEDQND